MKKCGSLYKIKYSQLYLFLILKWFFYYRFLNLFFYVYSSFLFLSIRNFRKYRFCGLEKNLIIVDDYSTDSTREILKRYEDKYTVIYKEKNGGKGSAVNVGFENAKSDIVIIQDADLEYNPSDYAPLLKLIIDVKQIVVYGSRFLGTPFKDFMFLSYVANKF